MKNLINDSELLSQFNLSDEDVHLLESNTYVITKKNWDYALSHQFQRFALKKVQEGQGLRFLICCSHPEILTNGRGLQKPRKGESFNLIEFNKNQHSLLPFPFFQIERGGGLTFHHPDQFIFYPIVKLNPKTLSLSKMIDQIFEISVTVLNEWGLENLSHTNKLLGLWHGEKKIASMGIAIEKLVTFHGMALNLKQNFRMQDSLKALNPCGLNSETYSSVESLINLPENSWEKFREQFITRIYNEWK